MRTTILSILALLLLASCDSLLSSDNMTSKGSNFESDAQTFYELTFKLPNEPDNQYIGLLIYTDDEHCKMRLVDNEMLEKNGCYEADYTCHVEEKEGGVTRSFLALEMRDSTSLGLYTLSSRFSCLMQVLMQLTESVVS